MQGSLNASLRFSTAPGGYLDDNIITDPQQLMHAANSQSQSQSQAPSSQTSSQQQASQKQAAKDALPAVSTAAAAAAAAKDKGKTVSPTSPNSAMKKRRKSKAAGMGGTS